MRRIFYILSLLLTFSFTVFAQENCNDGIDNDGDGLIDCNDPDCQFPPTEEQGCNCEDGIDNDGDGKTDVFDPKCAAFYGLTFVGDDTDCAITPPAIGDVFAAIGNDPAVSGQNTVDTQSKMAIGDVDGDGIPDVVATSKWNQTMRLIATTDDQDDGSDAGDVKASWKTTDPSAGNILKAGGSTFYFDLETLIADIDRDGTAELFATVYQRKNSNKQILAYYIGRWDYDGTKDLVNTWAVNLGSKRPGIPGIADFDGDGKGEIYLKNHIYDAHTGALLASAGGDWNTEVNAAPAAVDMTGDGRLELVSGRNIYTVGGSPVSSLSLLQDMNSLGLAQYFPKVLNDVFEYGVTNFSSTSVADFDDDGNIDVFISGAVGSTAGHTAIFYWNVAKGTVNTFLPTHPDTGSPPSVVTYPNGWPWGTGRVNLGELDGDGILEANFIAGNQLYALEEGPGGTLVNLWGGPKTLNDFRSGVVATTVYDFDNDGAYELVYRDTQVLSIIDGATGSTTYWSTSCQSHTMTEGPIIADINGDGGTDICVPCFTGPGLFKIDGGLSQQALGEIRVFFSGDNSWLPTRRVYNQPGYFVVNINDDLTLPFPQLGQTLIFGNDACANGLPGPQQPLNTFLNQVPNLGANGCPVYPGPDIAFVGNDPTLQPGDSGYVDPADPNYFPSVEVIPPICGDLAIVVNFNIINDGLRAITSDIPTSFWDGDPSVDPTASLLHTEVLPVTNFGIGDTLSYSGVTFNSTGKAFILYVVLNDDGTMVPPFPIGGPIEECKVGNNMVAFPIIPDPFTVQLEIIQDNNKCDDTAPDNGELRAIVFEGGVEAPDLSKYGFQWYAGPDTTAAVVPDPLGSLDRLTGMPEGSYTVVVTNIDKGCMSLPIDTTLVRIGVDPDINIIENSPQSQCSPFNGELEVQIVGGNAGFTFEWFKGAAFIPMGVTSAVISNLEKDDYVVRVTKDGCTKTASRSLSGPIFPDGVATTLSHVVDCANLNSGVIDADASVAGVIQDPAGFDFAWYHWDDATSTLGAEIASSFGTGKTRTGLAIGWYAVIVKNTGTNCESFPPVPTEVLDQTQFPTVTVSELQFNSSCDPLNPNGQLQVAIDLGGIPQDPALYTIEWFEGDNTSPVNQIFTTAGVNGEVVIDVGILATPYTVSVSSALNCASTDTLSVGQNIIIPVISAVAINNSICNPALASGNPFNGSANSSVTFNGVPVTPAELTADYSFVWYAGADITTDPIIPGEANPSLLNLDAGFYSVTVSLDSVGCTSLPITVEVQDIPTLPTILISEIPETTCSGTPNGGLSASVDVGGVPTITGYTFEWYVGIGTGGAPVAVISGTEGENALQLDGNQNYTARVINDATGCEDQLTFYLNDNSVTPVGTAVMTPNSVCDPLLTNPAVQYNGSVTATIELNTVPVIDYSPYEFTWYAGGSVVDPIIPGELTRVLSNVQEGFYTFTAFDLTLGCSSIPVTIEVTSNLVFAVISSTATPSTNCIPDTDPNGQSVADTWVDLNGNGLRDVGVEDLPGLFTYQWHTGVDTSTPIVGETNPTLSSIQGGAGRNYTIEVVHLASGCAQTYTVLLNDASELPIVSLVTTPNIGCTPGLYTGTVTATIMYKGVDVTASPDYSFAWSGPNAYSSTAAVSIAAVESGDFTLTVTNNVLSCVSLPAIATVLDNPAVITITDTNTPSTNCVPDTDPNGQIVSDTWVDLNGNGLRDVGVEDLPGLFTYQWHTGVDTSTPIVGETNPTLSSIQGGAGRNYTIEVVHLASGCAQTYTVLLNDASELPIVSLVTTPNIGCTPGLYTGTVTATIMYKGVDVTASPDYSFAWSGPNAYSSTAAISIAAVESGDFTLTITNNVLSCVSLPVIATVLDNPAVITIADTNTPSTNCVPDTDPNGQIVSDTWVDLNGNNIRDVGAEDLPALFTYQWHTGVDTSTPIAGEVNPTLSSIQGGAGRNYTLEILHLSSGCAQTYSVLLNDASELPIVSLVTTPNIGCTPGLYTGTVTATIMYKGVDVTASPDYSFAWSGPNAYSSTAAVSIAAVESGDFTLTVTNNVLSCVSLPAIATVLDNPAVITITDTNTPSTNCVPDTDPNGQIVSDTWVDLNGNGLRDVGVEDLPGLFTYQWHTGVDTSTPIAGEVNPTLSSIQGGAGRNYTIEVLHLASGCAQTYTVLLNDASELPIVSLVTTPNIGCTPGLYTGTVTATIMYKGVDVTASPDYSFAWSGPNAYSSTAAVSIAAVESGDFTLTVTNNVLSCVSLPVIATVLDNPAVITITDTNTPSTNCIPDTDPNGQIVSDTWVDLNGNGLRDVGVEDIPGLFTYQWHTGVDTSTPIVGETNPTLSSIQGGAGRNYTIEVVHLASGCTQTYTVLLNDASELPIVSLVTTPNIGCTPGLYTGTVTATIMYKGVDVTASPDYSFAWSGPNAYSSTAAISIAAVESGDFTLTVTNNVLSCVSLPVMATVLDNPAVITITDTNTPSTNCIPDTDPNGQIVADTWVDLNGNGLRDVGVEDLPGLFTYQWHTGVDTSTPIVGETNPTLSTVQGGAGRNYTIEVLHLASGCAQTYTVLLNDASELPIVTLTPTDNKGCTVANYSGTVTALVMHKGVDVTASGDYSFTWSSSDGAFVSVDAANIGGLKGSETYTITATNTVLGCVALDVTTTVDDSPDPIVIFFNNTRNNSCAATGNGAILAGVDTNGNGIYDPGVDDNLANLVDYNFTWNVGNTTTGILPASIPAVNNIDQLDGNEFYTLEVERISTGCINTHTEWVLKAVNLPQINLAVTSYTNCMTDVVVQAQIANLVDFFPLNDPDLDFTYTWYRGSDVATGTLLPAAGTIPNPSGQTLTTLDGVTELPADDYTVVVTHNSSTCVAPEKSNRILEPPVLFDINPVLDMAASNCGLLDGIAYVTVSANGSGYVLPAGPYTYDWYLGAPTNTAPVRNFDYVGPLGTDYNQVDNVTSASFFTDPIITFGGLAVEIDPVDDIGGTQDPNAVLSGVQDGLYTVVVTDANGCREYITFQIPFAQAQQSNIVTVTPDTDCTADNSSINVVVVPDIADVTNPLATDYDIYLFAGSNPTLPAPPAVPNPIDYLETQAGLIGGNTFPTIAGTMSPGVYTIVSQGQAGSRCFSIPTVVTIEEWANDPIVNLSGNINPNTSCDLPATPDGSLVLDIQHHPDEEFDLAAVPPITETTYEILAVPADASYANVAVGPGLAVGLHNVTGLGPTDYTITVTSSRGCSTIRTYSIPDEPFITEVTSFVVTNTTTCSPLNGSIEVSAINQIGNVAALSRSDFLFTWYYDINGNGVFDDLSLYNEAGEEINGNPDKGEVYDINNAGFSGPGIYWLEISALPAAGAGLDCPSAPIQFEIIDDSVDPIFTYDVTANTSCDPAGADGSFFIDPDRNSPDPLAPIFGGWTIDITSVPVGSTLPLGPNALALETDVFTATGLLHGQYDFTVIDDATGCSITTGSLNIPENAVPPILNNIVFTVLDQFECNPTGSITITQFETIVSGTPGPPVTAPTTAVDALMSNYEFTWYYDANGNAILDDAATRTNVPGGGATNGDIYQDPDAGFAGAGIYWVEITKVAGSGGIGCTSSPYQFEIIDDSVDPIFTYDVTANTSCDPAGADGSFFIDPDRNSPDPLAPIFSGWTIDITSVPVGSTLPLGPNVMLGVADVFTATGLLHGQYDFTVMDNATGCSITTGSLNIPENAVPPILNNIVFTVLDQFECNPTGSITITQFETIVSGTPGPPVTAPTTAVDALMSNYEFTWYYDANGNAILDDAATRTNVPGGGATNGDIYQDPDAGFAGAGIYWVEITKVAGSGGIGCTSSPYQFEIIDDSVDPIFTYDVTANTSCDPAGADGSFFIDPDRNSPDPLAPIFGGWTIDITSVPVGSTLPLGPNALALETDVFTATGLLHGQYDFTVIDDATGCSITTGSLNIPENAVPPILNNIVFTVLDQFECNPTGSITITQFETIVSGTPGPPVTAPTTAVDALMSNYEFTWYYDANGNAILDDAATRTNVPGGGATNGDIYQDPDAGFAGAGIYWVEITKVAGSGGIGCTSSPYQFEINDDSVDPIFTYDVTANTSCDPAGADGSFFIDPDRNSPDPLAPIFSGWTIDITSVPVGSTLPLGPNVMLGVADVFTATGLLHGQYDFTVMDNATGCSITTGSLNIPENAVPPILNNIVFTVLDQFECNPAGSITITQFETIVSGTPGPPVTAPTTAVDALMSNYEFTWYYDANGNAILDDAATRTNVPGGGATNGDIYQDPDAGFAGAGIYWVEITKVAGSGGIGCTSSPYQFEIIDDSVDPIFTYDVTANTSCDPAGADGSFFIDPDRNSPDPLAPIFSGWTIDITSVPVGSTLPLGPNVMLGVADVFTATGLLHGQYDFTVIDNATGCSITTGSLNIPENQLPPVLDNIGFTVVDQFICGADGSITITQIETVTSGTPGPPVTDPTSNTDLNMANYTFTWYIDSVSFASIVGDNNNVLDNTDAGFVGAANYLVEVTKIGANPGEGGVGCTSTPYLFEIRDESVNPLFSLNVSSNTACGPAGADGSVTITPNANGSIVPLTTWTYTFAGPSPIPPATNALASMQFTNLLPGDYTFTLSYDNTTCSTTGLFNIPDNPVAPLVLSPDPIIVHQPTCNVGGSITISSITTIESITLNSVLDVTLSNYEFIWYVGNDFNTAIQSYTDIGLSGSAGHIYDITDPGFIGAGTYWLEVRKINTSPGDGGLGCTSTPYKIVIEDQSIDPAIAFSQTSNTACNLAQANGSLTAAATTSGVSVPAVTSVFIWYNGPSSASPLFIDGVDGTLDQSVAGEETLRDVAPGIYTVNITDGNTGCFIEASFEVQDQPLIPDLNLDNAVTVDQTVCLPSGSITILGTDIIVGGVPLNAGDEFDFIFTWRLGSPTAVPLDSANAGVGTGLPIQGPRIDSINYLAMGAGTYYVTIASKFGIGAGCTGPPVSKVINDLSVIPTLSFVTTANSSCDIAVPNGAIGVVAQEADGSTDTYTFAWSYTGTGVMPPQVDIGATSNILNAPDGNYSVTVTNTITGCSFTQGQILTLDQTLSIPNNLDVIKTDPLDCNASGRIEVISVFVAGVPAVVANFEFEWYSGSISPANLILDGALNPITTPNLENQLPGKYFVIARNLNTKCESLAKEINILPDNIILPTVVIVENQPQSSCDVATPNGILSATVDGGNDDTNPNYLFTWYSGPVVNIANLIPNGNASILQNAAEGEYTVDVQNLITGCSMTSTFFVDDASELLRLQISATVIPVTLCTSDNGVLEVRVTNHPDLGNWQFDWTGPGGFVASGPIINNVSPGTYTVSAIDITGNFCPSVPAEAIITDERIIPPITIIEDNPLTNCDITKVNGQLSASVDGKVGGYDFEWYNGPTATGPIMHQANIYSQLDIGTYTVQVIDQLTQCANSASEDITDGTVTPPTPTATVLNNLNDCIDPDGAVTAVVNGSTLGYSFNWYDGSTVGSSPDETTPGYIDLDLGDYTVTATDLQTGCVSGPATVPITDERVYPEFEYAIVAANCQSSNGAIELVFQDAFDVKEVTWFDDSGVEVDRATNLYNYPPGDYGVTVSTFFGCETDGQASIPTEITNYNGISANGDGLNDDFQIDCINLFPNNIVKIFNRSGLLVYRGNNYDNIDIVFDGRGENGLYLIGENLPDGTYFYIIDKGDGSRPVTGYLELMR